MTSNDPGRAERFLNQWRSHWKSMDPEAWATLYHREGTLLQPGMLSPVRQGDIANHVRKINALLPDITCQERNWAARGDTVFTEWKISASLGGLALHWEGADRFKLVEEEALEEVVHYDTLPLWGQVDPTMKRGALLDITDGLPGPFAAFTPPAMPTEVVEDEVEPYAAEFIDRYTAAWHVPHPEEITRLYHPKWQGRTPTTGGTIDRNGIPAYYGKVLALLPDFRLDVQDWADNNDVVFIEWTISATVAGKATSWSGIDRHTIRGSRSIDGVSYFDSLPLWAQLDPTMARSFMLDSIGAAAAPSASVQMA